MIALNVCVYFKEVAMQIGGWIMKHHSIEDNKTKAKLKGKKNNCLQWNTEPCLLK
jgi:hypothetical protein